jgi:hypothetical protein
MRAGVRLRRMPFCVRRSGSVRPCRMRKRILQPTSASPAAVSGGWLDLQTIARVEVSSEAPQHPIEAALTDEGGLGWLASDPGRQTVRLLFDQPQTLHRIRLRFCEPAVARTQQFTLGWAPSHAGPFKEIVRQQWNFSPGGATEEAEDYQTPLDGVMALELTIIPDLQRADAYATLSEWRVA